MPADKRRKKRLERQRKASEKHYNSSDEVQSSYNRVPAFDDKVAKLLTDKEDDLLKFVVKVNKVYQEKLKRPAPFMTFVICGMQSAGKSTIMERFMSAVLNIVQEGTGTRCPLDTTCLHDESATEPCCDLNGEELSSGGDNMTVEAVFKAITDHNKKLADKDSFSTKPLTLVYRSNNVQNMRFVDTPGIISNKGQGTDNRQEIRNILREAMRKDNTKLCVLLEPKEFSTNPIIDFCDETFEGREWTENAIFLMTKFDKQLHDARTGSKANKFFNEFKENGIIPHLIITPTLPKEDLPIEELLSQRKELLDSATEKERNEFDQWVSGHRKFLEANPSDELLSTDIAKRVGFDTAKQVMRKVMLEDTILRLPEVLTSLKSDLASCQNDLAALKEKERYNDPKEVKIIIGQALECIEKRVLAYLDGDLEKAYNSPTLLQTLDDELEEEEDSDWCERDLNHHSSKEEEWRERLSDYEYIDEMQAEERFLGGKQVQRAIIVFQLIMIDSLPDPNELNGLVPTGAGYLQGGLQRENWERAITSITKMTIKKISHPGINFLIKHVGCILRRLFGIALEDVKEGDEISKTLKLLPATVERNLIQMFDEALWTLMKDAADKSHIALEPMYSSLDSTLPTFHPIDEGTSDEPELYVKGTDNQFKKKEAKKETIMNAFMVNVKSRMSSLLSIDGKIAKEMLKGEAKKRFAEKKSFLPDERTTMINRKESELVINRAYQYIVALLEFNNVMLRFQMNHYLYEGFKERLSKFSRDVLLKDWEKLIERDTTLAKQIEELESKIAGLTDSLDEVKKIQSKF